VSRAQCSMSSAFTIYSAYAHLTALLMMRCRTGTARSYAAPGSELVAVPEQRRTASRFPRPQIMEALVHALALRRIRDTGRVMRRHVGAGFQTRPYRQPILPSQFATIRAKVVEPTRPASSRTSTRI
jgi:hypothetical protein